MVIQDLEYWVDENINEKPYDKDEIFLNATNIYNPN